MNLTHLIVDFFEQEKDNRKERHLLVLKFQGTKMTYEISEEEWIETLRFLQGEKRIESEIGKKEKGQSFQVVYTVK